MSRRWIVALWVLFTTVCGIWLTAALIADATEGVRLMWAGFVLAIYACGCAVWACIQADQNG